VPIDAEKARGAALPSSEASWGPDQVILYHLGVGAAATQPTSPAELAYTYERGLKVLPSFGVIPVFGATGGMFQVPGLQIANPALILHGEQEIELHRPIPVQAKTETTGRVAGIYDKGKAALIVLEVATREAGGEPLFTNRFSIFARGEGGFGGDSGPAPTDEPPAREPDRVVESPTVPSQALLYRLTGDKNPLHADPAYAKLGGFDRPILHGLCSFGVVCKAVVDAELEGNVAAVARYKARFAGVVFPGETIVTSMWRERDRVIVRAHTKERGTPVISHSSVALRS
jgi:acyl dehydratase